MKTLRITELFFSLQGEGARFGEPSLFVRLSGCDMTCGFCDTEFTSGQEMELPEVADRLAKMSHECRWLVWTGGEPMLQLTEEVIQFFKSLDYLQAIESNGNHPIPRSIDWIVVSPKVAEHVLKKNFPHGVDELRYVRHKGQPGIPEPSITAKQYFLSPIFNGNQPDRDNVRHCINLCLQHPKWRLSLQLHKIVGVL